MGKNVLEGLLCYYANGLGRCVSLDLKKGGGERGTSAMLTYKRKAERKEVVLPTGKKGAGKNEWTSIRGYGGNAGRGQREN